VSAVKVSRNPTAQRNGANGNLGTASSVGLMASANK